MSAETNARSKASRLDSLQILRGIAATSVVLHHSLRALIVNRPASVSLHPESWIVPLPAVELGAIGVDIFFILSGFLMIHIARPYEAGTKSAGNFLLHRLVRIWPLYAFVTTLFCAPALLDYWRTGILPFDFQPFRLASYLFIPSFDEHGAFAPIFGIGWTLVYEMFFYLCFAAAILISRRHIFPIVTALVVGFFLIGHILPEQTGLSVFLRKDVMLEFLYGAACAVAVRRWSISVAAGIIAGLSSVILLMLVGTDVINDLPRSLLFGVPALLLFLSMLALNDKVCWPQWARFIGDASYSIYLFHMFVVTRISVLLYRQLDMHVTHSYALVLAALLATVIALCVGIVGYLLIERPLFAGAKHLLGMRKERRTASPRAEALASR